MSNITIQCVVYDYALDNIVQNSYVTHNFVIEVIVPPPPSYLVIVKAVFGKGNLIKIVSWKPLRYQDLTTSH
jgi:hypothetical protein